MRPTSAAWAAGSGPGEPSTGGVAAAVAVRVDLLLEAAAAPAPGLGVAGGRDAPVRPTLAAWVAGSGPVEPSTGGEAAAVGDLGGGREEVARRVGKIRRGVSVYRERICFSSVHIFIGLALTVHCNTASMHSYMVLLCHDAMCHMRMCKVDN